MNAELTNLKRSLIAVLIATLAPLASVLPQQPTAKVDSHVLVFREEGRFAGWPANHGIWSWGDEILVRFNVGWLEQKGEKEHAYDANAPIGPEFVWSRSMDGGLTWKVEWRESMKSRITWIANSPPGPASLAEEPRDFLNPDTILFIRGEHWSYSTDRGKSWKGWYPLPENDPRFRTTSRYLIDGPSTVTAFVESDPSEMQKILVFRTVDGGSTWKLVSRIGDPGPEKGFVARASPVRLSPSEIVVAVRRGSPHRIEIYRSSDNGLTWKLISTTVTDSGGTTPNMFKLSDGRFVLIYGFRRLKEESGIRARISEDQGRTWGEEFVLRGPAGNFDIGYPLTVRRADGKLVTVYYYNDDPSEERYIAATIWEPPKEE